MLKLVILAVLLMMVVTAVMAVLALVAVVALGAAIIVPAYLLSRRWLQGRAGQPALKPVERLQNLFAEGKIDLFEFETRVAHLVALE